MIIRFLDSKEVCYQVDSNKTPVLIYLESEEEVSYLHKATRDDVVMSIPKSLGEDNVKRLAEKLRTKVEPTNLK